MSHLGLLPIALVLVSACAFCFSYIVAVIRGDVSAAFPYISDTGADVPESCIFSLLLNIAAFLSFSTIYLRFKAVQALAGTEDQRLRRLNRLTMFLGVLSSIGCILVANFQEGSVVEAVHVVGASLTFIVGLIYCFLQTWMSYYMCPTFNGLYVCRARLTISLVSLACLTATIIAGAASVHDWNNIDIGNKNKFKWGPDDPGYVPHVVSTVGEWLTALTFLGFFFTYVREFHKFNLEVNTRPLVRHLDEDPVQDTPSESTHLLL
ncbi:DNA damage-regulated autophagy modulator protein 2-like [Babylonia areolata]|uniref:DNA damage-regulated autophagy modulator protein 2-like n=1 Tax=Babylonia areolata TaxID=304850 RepID=UPI003FD637BB